MARRVEFDGKAVVIPDNERPYKVIDREGSRRTSRQLDGETVFVAEVELAVGTSTTLWDAASNPVSGWVWAILTVDPDDEFQDNDPNAEVAMDFTADAVDSPAIVVRREAPMIFSSSSAGGPNSGALTNKTIDGAITRFRIWDHKNQTGIKHKVRLELLK